MRNKFGFILIKPQLGENIGASARSLKNFGFKNLIITNPKHGWPNIKAKVTSVGAFDILNKTKVLNSTISAIKNFDITKAADNELRKDNPDMKILGSLMTDHHNLLKDELKSRQYYQNQLIQFYFFS